MRKISKHISYREATHSNTATRLSIKNEPDAVDFYNMTLVANRIFEPLRNHFNEPIRINSFFRCSKLNKVIGGATRSQHLTGEAIDVDALNGVTNKQLFDYIRENLDFDKLIWEYGNDKEPDWVHFSYSKSNNRKQVYKAIRGKGYIKF